MSATQRLVVALGSRDMEAIEQSLSDGANVNYTNEFGESILMSAVLNGYPDVVRLLVSNETIQINQINGDGDTALLIASSIGNVKVMKELRGADVTIKNYMGTDALHAASRGGYTDCIKLLLNNGALINSIDKKQNTPLTLASLENKVDAVKVLLQRGANPNAVDAFGFTPLMYAINNNAFECVQYLALYKDTDINRENNNRDTALHVAILRNNAMMVWYLLKNDKIDIYATDINHMTPIQHAVHLYGVDSEVARLLRLHEEIQKMKFNLKVLEDKQFKLVKF